MVVDIVKGSHISGWPTKVASMMGQYAHVYNIVLQADTDNGEICKRGSYVSFDQYEQDDVAANSVKGIIREKLADGTWLVEFTNLLAEALFIYNSPVSEYSERDLQAESLMYNKAGEVAQGATLVVGDMISLSDVAFTGTPAVNAVVTYTAGKYVI